MVDRRLVPLRTMEGFIMSTCQNLVNDPSALGLPRAFEDLEGLVEADIQAIVTMLRARAEDRFLLSGRQGQRLETSLREGLSHVIQGTLRPLSPEFQ